MIEITANTRRAIVTNKELLTTGSAGIQVQFTLSEDWNGLVKLVVFRVGDEGESIDVALDSTLTCIVPSEVLVDNGEVLFIGIYGTNGDNTVIIPTIWASAGVIRPGTLPNSPSTPAPTPDIVTQIQVIAQNAEETADAAMSLVEAGLYDLSTLEANVESAEAARVTAEQSRVTAENGRVTAENSRANAETNRAQAESQRAENETQRQNTESARQSAESSRVQAETSRAQAEESRQANETSRASAESGRASAEQTRQSQETTRASNEAARVTAEQDRASAESGRVTAETNRVSAETARTSAESARATAEQNRASAETARASAESARATAESTRASNEQSRVSAESARVQAETDRATEFATWESTIASKADQTEVDDLTRQLSDDIALLADGYTSVDVPEITWVDGYVNGSGVVAPDSGAAVGIVALKAGETITVGTILRNCYIISTTEAETISVGDSVAVKIISGADRVYKEYVYIASENVNVVVGINKSNYNISIKSKTKIIDIEDKVIDKNLEAISIGNYINLPCVIKAGTTYNVVPHLISGSANTVILYQNSTDEKDRIAQLNFDVSYTFVASNYIGNFIGYITGNNGASVSLSVSVNSELTEIKEKLDEVDIQVLPEYASTMVVDISDELDTIQTSKSTSIAFLTDIHVDGSTLSDNTQSAMNVSAQAINAIAKQQPINFVMLNGDYLYNRVTETKSKVLGEYSCLADSFKRLNVPLFIGKGNHDVNDINPDSDTEYLSNEELYKAFLKYSTLRYTGEYGDIDKAYGYFDIPNQKTRYIFVNTVDVPDRQQANTGISNQQLNFIADALRFTDDDWGVVFISHHPLQTSDTINPGGSVANYLNPAHGGTQLLGVINAYRNNTTYSDVVSTGDYQYDISVDYSANQSNEVICMLSGHHHADRYDTVNGILMILTTSASYVYQGKDADGNVISRRHGTRTETSWDIFTIDRLNRTIYATRYGAGTNRQFTY